MKQYYERYWNHDEQLEDFYYKWPSIKKFIPVENNIKLLDYGCGKGKIIKEILKLNPKLSITGADISQSSITYSKKNIPYCKFVKLSDGEKFPFPSKTFDFITALDVLEHVYDRSE